MRPSIHAVIVTYQCGARLHTALAALSAQVERIIIVDNGSDAATISELEAAQRTLGLLHIIRNRENLGLAAAQNQGIRVALGQGATWVLLLDDDSVPAPDMLNKMVESWQAQPQGAGIARIGIVAPRYVEQKIDVPSHYLAMRHTGIVRRKQLRAGDVVRDAATVIASGSLIRCELFSEIGLMREGYFIDYIDHEFCLRARTAGFGILMVGDAVLQHQQGNKSYHRLLGKRVVTANYGPLRRYYIFRNRMFTLRAHRKAFPFLLPYSVATCGWDIARIVLFEENAREKLKSAWKGFYEGITKEIPPLAKL